MHTTVSSPVFSPVLPPGRAELWTRAVRAQEAVDAAERPWLAAACALAVTDHTDADGIAAAAHRYAATAAALTYARAVRTMALREAEAALTDV